MQRLLKALLLLVTCSLVGGTAFAQTLPIVGVSGRLSQGNYRVFTKDTLYQIAGQYTVSGALFIEPGTTVEFLPNGRLIDSVGGRIIADGELEAKFNGATPNVNVYPDRYCDVNFLRANVNIGGKPEITAPGPNHISYVPYLLFYYANGLSRCASDPNLSNRPYKRDVVRAPIVFRGRPVNMNSTEWGHIVILPGADTAFFRNVTFVNFRKDVQVVSSTDFYTPNPQTGYNQSQITAGSALNTQIRQLTTGGGGALTTFSSKTWLLECRFDSNFARFHGGAVQFLQAPYDASGNFYARGKVIPQDPSSATLGAGFAVFPNGNPEDYDLYGGPSAVDSIHTPFGAIPMLRSTVPASPANGVQYRQGYDDGRMAINQGRVRRLTFRDNRVLVGNTVDNLAGYRDTTSVTSLYSNPLYYDQSYGGAMYISGPRRYMTVFLGRGTALDSLADSTRAFLGIAARNGDPTDTMLFERNHAVNYQNAAGSDGAKGGAIYVGDSTSMHFSLSRFIGNFTATPNVPAASYLQRGSQSQGGAIYMSPSSPVLTAIGNVRFTDNKSGRGGAIYIAALSNPLSDNALSPVLGDSSYFISNKAEYDGGAIYTQRNTYFYAPYLTSIDSTQAGFPIIDRRILFDSNAAGLTGGAVVVDNQTNPSISRARIENVLFRKNSVDSGMVADTRLIKLYNPAVNPIGPGNRFGTWTVRDDYNLPGSIVPQTVGGGALYSVNGNTNFFRSVEFLQNWVRFGNGGAVSMVLPGRRDNRYFLAQGDSSYDFVSGLPIGLIDGPEPTDQRQMTRFLQNVAIRDTAGAFVANPHGDLIDPNRNGTGLGGAIYINDQQPSGGVGTPRTDSVMLHRVRIEEDTAWSGSAVYSDNYDLRVIFNKSLVANNDAVSNIGAKVDVITNYRTSAAADSLAGATFYGEIEGPTPTESYHVNANAIYNNNARFIIRLPDRPVGAPVGFSGVDTVRGNFWGRVEAPVTTVLPSGTLQNTFYIQGDSCTLPLKNPAIPEQQGPFESTRKVGDPVGSYYTYTPVPVGVIPDTLLFEGRVYDIFDKGRDIKAVDYSAPRLAPIEDFAVGIPPHLLTYATGHYAGKVVRRLTRDPYLVDQLLQTNPNDPYVQLQREFVGDHPIGYPLFLESRANYIGNGDLVNDDKYALNYSTFYVINVETGEIIRSNSKQVSEGSNLFRSRVEFVADSINRDPLERRTYEGRAAFSVGQIARLAPQYYLESNGWLPNLPTRLDSLKAARAMAAAYEDSVTVPGRRYGGFISPTLELGGPGFKYENRTNPPSFVDVYAGERYRALPVKVGDRVWVISRTMMWRTDASITQVVNDARFTGLEFQIAGNNSIAAPIIFGQRDSLENKQPSELRNTRWLVEDQNYISDPTGRDTSKIFEVTANDINGFFDPRSIFFPDRYTALRYEWYTLLEQGNGTAFINSSPAFVRLASWLHADTVYPNQPGQRDSTRGFLRFYGQPHNPDVVPGGELLEVRVSNYPPGVRTIDSLRGLLPDSVVSRYVFLYPPYFNCQVYDQKNARYLNQDTVDVGGSSTATYRMRIFVQDTPPVFLPDSLRCSNNGRTNLAVANLTNKLRFDFDVNTDDEVEDKNAQAEGWTFPYGRTTYGFVFNARNNPTDTSLIHDDVAEIRPVWMADSLLRNPALSTDNGAALLTQGKVVLRIDSLEAINMLRNPAQANNAFNLDTVFTVYVHDGHTGQNKRDMRAIVNVAPQLQPAHPAPATLPPAKEDTDYNPALLDSTRAVKAVDLNFNQRLRYYLVYQDDALNRDIYQTGKTELDSDKTVVTNTAQTAFVARDKCYWEAGLWRAPKTTPSWLKVNPISGLLYGTPRLADAPKTVTVTVVVEDEFGLTDVRTYSMRVDSTQHLPKLFGRPPIVCIDPNVPYVDSLCVRDLDLGRPDSLGAEQLTLEVLNPPGLSVSPSTIDGQKLPADSCLKLTVSGTNVQGSGKQTVTVKVTDKAGNIDTLSYDVMISEQTLFTMPLLVENTNAHEGDAFQRLIFGIARNATTGEEQSALGRLDSQYCEIELPPSPPLDVFDARWTIPTENGVLRDIFPQAPGADEGPLTWKGIFQPGFLEGGSVYYPVTIHWSISDAQKAPQSLFIMDPLAGAVFRIDMKAPTGNGVKLPPGGGVQLVVNGDTAAVRILASSSLKGFHITYGLDTTLAAPAVTGVAGYSLSANVPNPFSNETQIAYTAPNAGKVMLEVFDVRGERVATLVDEVVAAGRHVAVWNGKDESGQRVPSGTYTYRLTAGQKVLTRTMVLTR